jgi:iron complex transport system substrate-binding protein
MSAALLLAGLLAGAPTEEAPERLVTLGAGVTETAAALGLGDRIVGVDTTSRWPEALADVPRVGYLRTLPAEGILSLAPTLVLGSEAAGPEAALAALRGAGIPVRLVSEAKTWPEAKARMHAVGDLLGEAEAARALTKKIEARLAALERRLEDRARPRVLFLFAHGRDPVVGGAKSVPDTMIRLAGGENALSGLEGFRRPSAEAVLAAAPEVIVTTPRVMKGLGGRSGVRELPALAGTPAAREDRIVALDGAFLLALGPRTADAAEALAAKLHPEAKERSPR